MNINNRNNIKILKNINKYEKKIYKINTQKIKCRVKSKRINLNKIKFLVYCIY